MSAMEASNNGRPDETANTLQPELSHDSSRAKHDLEIESESIASALVGNDGVEDEEATGNDLEKAATVASKSEHEPATRIATATDWAGPDDHANPFTWPLWQRAYHVGVNGFLAFAVTTGSSLITPATPEIQEHFNVSRTVAILPLTLYVLGLAFGPVIAAPLSETYGRSIVFKGTAIGFLLFLLGSGFSKSLGSLLVCRFLAGAVGGPVLAVGAGATADLFPPHIRAIPGTTFVMMPFLGPAIGPIVGGFAAQYKGWRWTQWCTIFIGIAALVLMLPSKETYKKVILKKRAKKLGIPGPPGPPVTGWKWMKLMLTITLFRPVHMLFMEPIVLFLSLYNSFTFGVLFCFFGAYPYTFETVYGFSTSQSGLAFLGIMTGVLIAVATSITIDRTLYTRKYRAAVKEGKTNVSPDHRLYAAMIGSFGVPIGLFWFAWTARPGVHWISPILAGIPFAWGNLCIFISAGLYLMDVYGPLNGASAMAANGIARYSFGAVFPLFTFQMYETLGIDWATSLLGFVAIAMMPIPFVLFKYGHQIRAKSSYEVTKF